MNVVIEITGMKDFLHKLTQANVKYTTSATNGLKLAGNFLMRESLKIVPVQTGNLKASYFVRKVGLRQVDIGYEGVSYGPYVHEIPPPSQVPGGHAHGAEFNLIHAKEIAAAAGTWRGTAAGGMFLRKPEEQYKFLEKPIRDNISNGNIRKIVINEVKKVKP